ncbi:MAG: LicD family protein [Clostridia bacterium]|nr:LicD family protein [Clostridia bacterium]
MNPDTLRKLQLVELEILQQIDKICKNNGISYFLDSGTALGAVRHGGFIPWDDDVDVGMLREEYDRFIEIARNELDSRYCLQTRENEPDFGKYSAKIRKRGTIFPEKNSENLKERGIFVDIYPFDYTDSDLKKAGRHINKARKMLLLLRFIQIKEKRASIVKRIIHAAAKLLIPEKKLEQRYLKHCKKYAASRSSNITCFSYRMARDRNLIFSLEMMTPSVKIQFEGNEFLIMNNADYYLKIMYNDYMKLPPEEKRISHITGEVVFDCGETEHKNEKN